MMTQKEAKKTLSKSILEMKFMKKSKEKYSKELDEAEGRSMFASEVTEAMRAGENKLILEPSYVPCEGLIVGRLSYHGMNPEIERLTQQESKAKVEVKEKDDMEISDLEMARRYNTLIGTIFGWPKKFCTMPTYYEILGCDKTASYEELKKCYCERVRKCHPDKLREEPEVEFDVLDKAWKTLRNPDTRREYDLMIGKNDLDEMPLYCQVKLSDMSHTPETGAYSYVCRCGGVYHLTENDVNSYEKLKVPCDECTFHIAVLLKE